MKKQIWIKIIVSLFFIFFIATSLIFAIQWTKEVLLYKEWIQHHIFEMPEYKGSILAYCFSALNLFLLIVFNACDIKYLFESIVKKYFSKTAIQERNKSKEQKKQAKLQAEIAEKQAMLAEMKKE